MCINWGCAGHIRSECQPPPPPPRCPTTLACLGYGTKWGSFYFVDAEIEEEVSRPHLASVTVAPEQVLPPGLVISADLIQAELAAYIGDFRDSEFTWEGRRLTFELESPAMVDLHGSAPNATVPGDDGRDEDGGSSEESSFCKEDDGDGGVPPAAFDGRRTPFSTATGPSRTAGVASGTGSVVLNGPSPVVTTLLALDVVEILGGSSPVVTLGC
ncbi:hypothetical protein D1007_16129 [Hordeum vulgare]|nr:hypothetical protein D1007_16129 [Hordeum vulgare]